MSLHPTRLVAALAACLSLAAPLFAQTMPGTNPVKIFIVAGESNTSGKGTISPAFLSHDDVELGSDSLGCEVDVLTEHPWMRERLRREIEEAAVEP